VTTFLTTGESLRARLSVILAVGLLVFSGASTAVESFDAGLFRVEYPSSEETMAKNSLDVLQQAVVEFSPRLPAGDQPIRVRICGSLAEFQTLAREYGRAHVGGIAEPERGLIVLKSPRLLPSGHDYRGTIRHELLHVLLARNTDPAHLPRWFGEGVAMVMSRENRWGYSFRVARAYARGDLIPYPDLNLAFAPRGDEALFDDAYAQVYSITRFLLKRVGEEKFWSLTLSLKHMDFEQALKEHAGLTPGGLYSAWCQSLWKVALISALVSGFGVFQLAAMLVVAAYVRKHRQGLQTLREWKEDEEDEQDESNSPTPESEEYFDELWEQEDDDNRP